MWCWETQRCAAALLVGEVTVNQNGCTDTGSITGTKESRAYCPEGHGTGTCLLLYIQHIMTGLMLILMLIKETLLLVLLLLLGL